MPTIAQQLKEQTAAVRLNKSVFRVRKRLNKTDRDKAAQSFDASASYLMASKKLLDTSELKYKTVLRVISRAKKYWKAMTTFYPVKGVRLIRKDLIPAFETQMKTLEDELTAALDELCARYQTAKQEARLNLGSLYSASDYQLVTDFREQFFIEIEYPSVDPPNYLKELNPALYEQAQQQVEARFAEAMATAEQALATELQDLISHLCDKLAPSAGGKRRSLSAKAVDGLKEFVDRFKQLNISSNSQLEALVSQADHLAKGIDPAALKKSPDQQAQLFGTMAAIKEALDPLIVDAPTRKITLEDE